MKRGAKLRARAQRVRKGEQLELVFRTWGGRRAGAGRKKVSTQTVVHHRRPKHSRHNPLTITLRVVDGVPSLRSKKVFRIVSKALLLANTRGKHAAHFRVTHFSVQSNHVHLVAEASNAQRLSRGVQGLAVRVARRLNLALGRRGRLFSERYHSRPLKTPREVRHALAYVLLNERRHLAAERGLSLPPWYFDPCSSSAEFDGWRPIFGLSPPAIAARQVTVPAQTFLLTRLWRRYGLIAPDEVPGSTSSRRKQ